MALTHEKKIHYGILAAVVCLLVMVALAAQAVYSYRSATALVCHTVEVGRQLESVQLGLKNLQIEGRTYALTGDPPFPTTYPASFAQVSAQVEILRQMTVDNRAQQKRLDAIAPLIEAGRERTKQLVETRKTKGVEAAAEMMRGLAHTPVDGVHQLLAEMKSEEFALLEARQAQADRSGVVGVSVLAIGFALCGAELLLLKRLVRQREADIRAVAAHAREIDELYNNAPCGYHSVDEAGVFQAVNDTELRWLGYTRGELVGKKRHADLLTPQSRARYEELFKKFKTEGQARDLAFDMVRKDGSILPVLLNSTVVRDEAGHFVGTRTTLYDYSERKKADEMIVKARSHAESIVETVRAPLVILDADLNVRGVNRAFYATFQKAAEETLGRPFTTLAGGAWNIPSLIKPLGRIQTEHNTIEDFEVSAEFPRIGKRVMLVNARKLYRPGNNTEFVLLAIEDITERKRYENIQKEFRALFESLPGACLVLTPDLTISAVTDAYLQATMTKREDILGKNLFAVFPDNPEEDEPTGTSNLRASLQRVLKNGQPDTMAIQRYDIRRPDGTFELRYWSPINSPVFGADRTIQYIIHRVEDVTAFMLREQQSEQPPEELQRRLERMEAEIYASAQATEASNQKLRMANEELEAFSYSVSHDLRAPLRHISGFSQMLDQYLGGKLDEKAQHYLRTIGASSRQMGVLIDGLLAFSRIGRSEMKVQRVNLGPVVKSVMDELTAENGNRKIAWAVAPLPEVEGDSVLLRQVFANLLGNAVKYSSRAEEPRIEVGTEPAEEGTVSIFVKDNGAGFDPKYAHKLFGVFQRLHTAKEFEGNGVGLATVRRIVQRHGGRVWAEGAPGAGAKFTVNLKVPSETNATPSSNPTHS